MCGYGVNIRVGGSGVALYDLDPHQSLFGGGTASETDIASVEFDEPGAHVVATGMAGQHADDVVPLAGAHTDDPDHAGRAVLERLCQMASHHGQSMRQRRRRVVIRRVPRYPVPIGHPRRC